MSLSRKSSSMPDDKKAAARHERDSDSHSQDLWSENLILEFPPDTTALINRLADHLHLKPAEVVSRALGLLEVWDEAERHDRILVERPRHGEGKEFTLELG